jgi:hypothetical protein
MKARFSITGTATLVDTDDTHPGASESKLRELALAALEGAEIHCELDGLKFVIETEHDPHGDD